MAFAACGLLLVVRSLVFVVCCLCVSLVVRCALCVVLCGVWWPLLVVRCLSSVVG